MFRLGIPPAVYIGDEGAALRLRDQVANWPVPGIDTETTGLRSLDDQIHYWSLANEEERYCIPRHYLHLFKSLLEDPDVEWANQNANFDGHMMANAGIQYVQLEVTGNRNDPMIMHALADDTAPHGLDFIATNLLGIPGGKLFSYKEHFGKTPIQLIVPGHPLFNDMVDYASMDAWLHLQAFLHLKDLLSQEKTPLGTLWDYYKQLECPLHDVLWAMERRGVRVDTGSLRPMAALAQQFMDNALKELLKAVGRYINPASAPQLRALFYDECALPITKKTKGGKSGNQQGSTDEEVLREWALQEGLAGVAARWILEYRKHQKLKGTYIDGLLERRHPRTGRVHTHFTQHVARTGRLSSVDPNLMNIPRQENDPYGLRKAFGAEIGETAEEDYVLLCGDYDQVEMMLAASNSGDAGMLRAIREGRDLHCNTAALMFGLPYEDIRAAKKKKDRHEELTPYEKDLCLKRQQAKCLVKGSLVSTEQGLVPIEQLVLLDHKEETFSPCYATVHTEEGPQRATQGFFQGLRPTRRLTLRNGVMVEGSRAHRLRVMTTEGNFEWRTLADMREGDLVALKLRNRFKATAHVMVPFNCWKRIAAEDKANLPSVPITKDWAALFGYLTGDGHIHDKGFVISVGADYKEEKEDLRKILRRLGLPFSESAARRRSVGGGKMGVVNFSVWSVQTRDFLLHCGVKKNSKSNTVPWPILTSPWEVVASFLRRYFECDGSHAADGVISCSSACQSFLQLLQQVLLNAGICSTLSQSWNKLYKRYYYKLHICGEDREAYLNDIGFVSERKQKRGPTSRSLGTTIPQQRMKAEAACSSLPYGQRKAATILRGVIKGEHELTEHRVFLLRAEKEENPTFQFDPELLSFWDRMRGYRFSPVTSVVDSEGALYDLSVPAGHNYIAQGVVNHNTIGFGVLYGEGPKKLAEQLGISFDEAKKLQKLFFGAFPSLRQHIDEVSDQTEREEVSITRLGRRRRLPNAGNTMSKREYFEALRQSFNFTVQGFAAEVIKAAMLAIARDKRLRELDCHMLLQVHDELLFECPPQHVDECSEIIHGHMTSVLAQYRDVPLSTNIGRGMSWQEAK